MYTEQDVRNAYYSLLVDRMAKYDGVSISYVIGHVSLSNDEYQRRLSDYNAGSAVRQNARVVTSKRFRRGTATTITLQSTDAPTVLVSAGHIANDEAVRMATLIINR